MINFFLVVSSYLSLLYLPVLPLSNLLPVLHQPCLRFAWPGYNLRSSIAVWCLVESHKVPFDPFHKLWSKTFGHRALQEW